MPSLSSVRDFTPEYGSGIRFARQKLMMAAVMVEKSKRCHSMMRLFALRKRHVDAVAALAAAHDPRLQHFAVHQHAGALAIEMHQRLEHRVERQNQVSGFAYGHC